ncbi:MAG: glycosyltransferase family 4 protein [Desulfofustis sp.]|nr:glycosyltransferase family 4 protein [Desulfofustis sp.]
MSEPAQPTLAYILKGYPRISETFISNEILLLERLGFKLRLFPMRRPRENFCHESVKQIRASVDYLPTELILDLPRLIGPNVLYAAKNPAAYRTAIAMAAHRYRRTGRVATFKHLFQAGFLVQKHLRCDPSIVHLHGHFAHSPTSVTMFAAHLSGLPFSFTAHAKDIYTSDPEQLREKIARAMFVATCTEHNKGYLETLADQATPVHCIYHGIDLSLFKSEALRTSTRPPYHLFTVARLTEKKGLPTVFQALRILADRGISFQHTLIGDGDDRDRILALIDELELTAHCTWLGTRPHQEVLDQFKKSDLFVLGCEIASNGDRDGIPNVLVESLAMGVPAVAPEVSAIAEILVDGKTGLTVAQKDSAALAGAMERLLTDSVLRRNLIEGGRQFVQNRFNNETLISDLADVFAAANPRLRKTSKAA